MDNDVEFIQEKIFDNIHYFAKNICNLPVLLNLLLEQKILETTEIESIKGKETPYEKQTELCTTIRKKGEKLLKFPDCLRRSGNESVAQKLLEKKSDIILEETCQIWFNVNRPIAHFYGRDNEMKFIENNWDRCYQSKRLIFVALTGLGGVGKTELARRYSEIFYHEVKGHVIWIDSETTQSIRQSVENFAEKELKIPILDASKKEKSLGALISDIYEKLRGTRCLIILDNIESYNEEILKILHNVITPQNPSLVKPFVLLTSRYSPVGRTLGEISDHLVVDVLSEESANKYMSLRLKISENDEKALDLTSSICRELKYFPLALNQAAAYIDIEKTTSTIITSMEKYLEKLNSEAKDVLSHPIPKIDDISSNTYLTWKLTLEKIRKIPEIGKEAIEVINFLSFFSPDTISTKFILKILKRETYLVKKFDDSRAINLLCDYSMCTLSNDNLKIHRLVQKVIQLQLKEENKWGEILNYLIHNLYFMLPDRQKIPVNQIVHVKSVWEHAVKENKLVSNYEDIPNQIFLVYYEAGRFKEALEFCNDAISLLSSKYKEKHQMTLKMMFCKGSVLEDLAEYDEALEIQLKTYELQKDLLGDEDEDCLLTSREVGLLYYRKKDYSTAKIWTLSAINKRENRKTDDEKNQRELQGLKNNLANIFCEESQYEEALKIYKEVLTIKEKLLGKEHFGTLLTLHNIGTIKFDLKQYLDAKNIFTDVLEKKKRVQGDDHPETLKTKCWLAKTNKYLKDYKESLLLANEVSKKYKDLNMCSHDNYIQMQDLIAELNRSQKKTQKQLCSII